MIQELCLLTVCEGEALLLVVGEPDAVPGVVVARVDADGVAVAGQRLLQLLDHHVLVPQQRVGVGKVGLHLKTREKAETILKFL